MTVPIPQAPAATPATHRCALRDRVCRCARLLAVALLVAGAARPSNALAGSGRSTHPRHEIKRNQSGMASFYGRECKGRRTASGERFDPNQLTAAHRTLPFGTLVKVTNLDNGRHVVVRINDRGPYARNRVLDLSRAAARKLGFEREGTAYVRLQVVKHGRGEGGRMADDEGPLLRSPWHTPIGAPARGKSSRPPRAKPAATRRPLTDRA
jgi:rare lipoprotein A